MEQLMTILEIPGPPMRKEGEHKQMELPTQAEGNCDF